MAESAKKKAGRSTVAAVPDAADASEEKEEEHLPARCPVSLCPICGAVELLRPVDPDVVEHLLRAGREFLLAAKAALDVLTPTPQADEDPLEKIDIG